MKKSSKLLWIAIGLIVFLLILGFLYSKGLINVKWQWLSVILVTLAAPFQFLTSYFSNTTVRTSKIMQKQMGRIDEERKHRAVYDKIINDKEARIQELEAEVAHLQEKIDQLELQQQVVEQEVNDMSDDELYDELQNIFSDEI